MKTSVIRYRVADFLRDHPPFDLFTLEELLAFSGTGRVIFHEDDIFLFRSGDSREPVLWIIQQGKVEIIDETPAGEYLRDVLGPGDILGLTRMPDAQAYSHTARTATEVILYSFDLFAFEALVSKHPEAARFLTAHLSATSQHTKALNAPANRERLLNEQEKAVWLNAPHLPAGWMARRLATRVDAESLMDRGVRTARPGLSNGEYLLEMLRSRQQLLAITIDGSVASPLQGLVSDTDLSISCGRNPVPLILEILKAESVAELAYLRSRADALVTETLVGPSVIEWLSQMLSEINAALLERIVEIARAELASAGRPHPELATCWLFIGGAGRQELLDQQAPRLGLVFADPANESAPEVGKYFRTLAQKVVSKLQACGLTPKPHHFTASQGLDCRALSAWQDFYAGLIKDPITNAIYTSREYFDLKIAAGGRALGLELEKSILLELGRSDSFIPVLANDTIASLPPLTFFQGAIIDPDGAAKNSLDLEKNALDPITDSARVLALADRQISISNTIDRLTSAIRSTPQYASVLNDAIEGWRIVAYQHALAKRAQTEGRAALQPPRLSRFEQRMLKSAFDSIRRLLELTYANYGLTVAP